jgi:hypothetical protein
MGLTNEAGEDPRNGFFLHDRVLDLKAVVVHDHQKRLSHSSMEHPRFANHICVSSQSTFRRVGWPIAIAPSLPGEELVASRYHMSGNFESCTATWQPADAWSIQEYLVSLWDSRQFSEEFMPSDITSWQILHILSIGRRMNIDDPHSSIRLSYVPILHSKSSEGHSDRSLPFPRKDKWLLGTAEQHFEDSCAQDGVCLKFWLRGKLDSDELALSLHPAVRKSKLVQMKSGFKTSTSQIILRSLLDFQNRLIPFALRVI